MMNSQVAPPAATKNLAAVNFMRHEETDHDEAPPRMGGEHATIDKVDEENREAARSPAPDSALSGACRDGAVAVIAGGWRVAKACHSSC